MARRTEVFIIFMLKCLQAFLCVTVSTLFVDGAYLDDGKRQLNSLMVFAVAYFLISE